MATVFSLNSHQRNSAIFSGSRLFCNGKNTRGCNPHQTERWSKALIQSRVPNYYYYWIFLNDLFITFFYFIFVDYSIIFQITDLSILALNLMIFMWVPYQSVKKTLNMHIFTINQCSSLMPTKSASVLKIKIKTTYIWSISLCIANKNTNK